MVILWDQGKKLPSVLHWKHLWQYLAHHMQLGQVARSVILPNNLTCEVKIIIKCLTSNVISLFETSSWNCTLWHPVKAIIMWSYCSIYILFLLCVSCCSLWRQQLVQSEFGKPGVSEPEIVVAESLVMVNSRKYATLEHIFCSFLYYRVAFLFLYCSRVINKVFSGQCLGFFVSLCVCEPFYQVLCTVSLLIITYLHV